MHDDIPAIIVSFQGLGRSTFHTHVNHVSESERLLHCNMEVRMFNNFNSAEVNTITIIHICLLSLR